jgi:Lrp/AsnC family transcriptional regulator, leucine-responsive regulatory protein
VRGTLYRPDPPPVNGTPERSSVGSGTALSPRWGMVAGRNGGSRSAGGTDPATGTSRPDRPPIMGPVLDERDLAIVAALQDDARATYAEVARRVGLSPSSVHQRVRRLEAAGVIRGYRAVVDPEALGLYVTALVSIMPLDPKQPDDLPQRVQDLPEIEDCFSVAGDENYVLKVRTRTTGHLEDFLRTLREKAGVRTRTTVVLSIPFERRAVGGWPPAG